MIQPPDEDMPLHKNIRESTEQRRKAMISSFPNLLTDLVSIDDAGKDTISAADMSSSPPILNTLGDVASQAAALGPCLKE